MKKNTMVLFVTLLVVTLITISGCGGGSSGGTTTSTLLAANAGNDIVVNKYASVLLDASSSSNATSYKWTQTEGPAVSLSGDTSLSPGFTPKSSATYKFTLEVSNADGSDSDEMVVVVQNISTISITSPTSDDAIALSVSAIEIAGTAGQNIASVVVNNRTTGSTFTGQLDSNGGFSAQDIVLVDGDNDLEVIGTDNTGALTKDSILVTYNQSVNYLSSPIFSLDSGFINETAETVVSVAIEENQYIVPDGVTLLALDDTGSVVPGNVTTLYDNGVVSNGDDIAGDGVWSAKTSINKSDAGVYSYRISANTGVVGYSSPINFTVLTPLTDQEIQSADEKTETAFINNFPVLGSKFTQTEFDLYKDKILAELLSLQGVTNAELSADGNSIVVEYSSGLIHTIDFVYAGTKSGGRSDLSGNSISSILQPEIEYYSQNSSPQLSYKTLLKASALTVSKSQTDNNSIGSYRALALSPFKWQFDPSDDIDGAYVEVQNSNTPAFTAHAPVIDYDVTVEHFKNLSQYGVVVISSHGGLEGSNPVIYTGEEATSEKQKTYQKDIDANRLMISHKITILVEDGGFLWFDSKESKEVFKIAPSFITKYNTSMPNTLVYMSICQGMATDALANAFINAGSGAFVGYTDIVNASYAFNAGKTFFESMINGKNVKDAVKDATDAHGINDADSTPAAFVYRGNGDLVLERIGIQNGGFEENLKYWEQNGGDIRIIAKLSSLSPQEGSYMAILSSGLGSVSDANAIITQQFKIPAGVDFLSFDYDVLSEEPMEYVGSAYDDKFRAVLIDEDGNEIQLAYETVNTSSWTAIGGSQSDGGLFDGGDNTAFHTGWKSVNHQITSLAGQTVTIKFRVWDVGDSVYDTAAVLDNVILQ